jgi:hypothetical protein
MQLWHSCRFLVAAQALHVASVNPTGQPLTLLTGLGVMPAIHPSAASPVPKAGGLTTSPTCFRLQVPMGQLPSRLQPAPKRPKLAAGVSPRMLLVAEMGDMALMYAVQEPALPQPS